MKFIHLRWEDGGGALHGDRLRYTEVIRSLLDYEIETEKATEDLLRHFQRQAPHVKIITELPGWYYEAVLTGTGHESKEDPWTRRWVNADSA